LTGEKSGRIQLHELKNKFVLRTYAEFTNRINSMQFSEDKRRVVACANETGIRMFDISEYGSNSVLQMTAAHGDNVKKVQFLSD